MIPLCILFLHHADDPVTRHHYRLAKDMNPLVPVIPLTFQLGLPEAVRLTIPLPAHPRAEWRNVDRLIYHWFNFSRSIQAERYLILESDTYCNISANHFYSDAWSKPATGALVRTLRTDPRLWALKEVKHPYKFGNRLTALTPISGILLSHEALSAVSEIAENPLYNLLFSEVRIGTMLVTAGFPPERISESVERYISSAKRVPISPGIWHSVKQIYSSNTIGSTPPK